jgi:hypothetical protein
MSRTPITDEQIETIKATYAATGEYAAAARAAGCAESTARKYAGSRDEFEAIRGEKRPDLIAAVTERVKQVQLALLDSMMDADALKKATLQEKATAFGIATDKMLLMTGQATARVETGSIDLSRLTPKEREALADLREKVMNDGAAR